MRTENGANFRKVALSCVFDVQVQFKISMFLLNIIQWLDRGWVRKTWMPLLGRVRMDPIVTSYKTVVCIETMQNNCFITRYTRPQSTHGLEVASMFGCTLTCTTFEVKLVFCPISACSTPLDSSWQHDHIQSSKKYLPSSTSVSEDWQR